MKKHALTSLYFLLLLSGILPAAGNPPIDIDKLPWIVLNFPKANSRDTYFSIHNVKAAHEISMGKGVKVGILDWGFAFEDNKDLYAGGLDFSSNPDHFNHQAEHGFWMANTLKEVAPECEVYALGTYVPGDEDKWVDMLTEAIYWAIANGIDILSMSHQQISAKNRGRLDAAVDKAVAAGIVTTFIHYDNPNNILPYPMVTDNSFYDREGDLNIYHYDYNMVMVKFYLKYVESGSKSGHIPFMSYSSMSQVLAGFVAILKSIDNSLTPEQYRKILVDTSREMHYRDDNFKSDGIIPRVADIGKAAEYMVQNYK